MKPNFYWIKIGLLIGLGFVVARVFLPLVFLLGIVVIPVCLAILIVAIVARFLGTKIGNIQGQLKLRQGWAARGRR